MSNVGPEYERREVYYESDVGVAPAQPVAAVQQTVAAAPVQRTVLTAAPVQPVVAQPVVARSVVQQTAFTRHFSPDAIVTTVVGLAVLVIGLIAITRAGFDGPMTQPVVEVLGFTHTTTLGLIEVAIGACLLISGATSSRSAAIFFGTVLGIGAFVGAVQEESFRESLALEPGLAWLLVIASIVIVATALLMPRFVTRSTMVHTV